MNVQVAARLCTFCWQSIACEICPIVHNYIAYACIKMKPPNSLLSPTAFLLEQNSVYTNETLNSCMCLVVKKC